MEDEIAYAKYHLTEGVSLLQEACETYSKGMNQTIMDTYSKGMHQTNDGATILQKYAKSYCLDCLDTFYGRVPVLDEMLSYTKFAEKDLLQVLWLSKFIQSMNLFIKSMENHTGSRITSHVVGCPVVPETFTAFQKVWMEFPEFHKYLIVYDKCLPDVTGAFFGVERATDTDYSWLFEGVGANPDSEFETLLDRGLNLEAFAAPYVGKDERESGYTMNDYKKRWFRDNGDRMPYWSDYFVERTTLKNDRAIFKLDDSFVFFKRIGDQIPEDHVTEAAYRFWIGCRFQNEYADWKSRLHEQTKRKMFDPVFADHSKTAPAAPPPNEAKTVPQTNEEQSKPVTLPESSVQTVTQIDESTRADPVTPTTNGMQISTNEEQEAPGVSGEQTAETNLKYPTVQKGQGLQGGPLGTLKNTVPNPPTPSPPPLPPPPPPNGKPLPTEDKLPFGSRWTHHDGPPVLRSIFGGWTRHST